MFTRPSDAHILAYTLGGNRRHQQWRDGKHVIDGVLPAQSISLVHAGVEPRCVLTKAVDILHIYIPRSQLAAQAAEMGSDAGGSQIELVDPAFRADRQLELLCQQVDHVLPGLSVFDRMLGEHLASAICIWLLQRWSNIGDRLPTDATTHDRSSAVRDPRLRRAIDYLEEHLSDDVSLAELATRTGISSSHLSSLFRAATGQPPHSWLMRRRMQRACELLAASSVSVTEVAHACGYCSSQHLATVFRQYLGTTPTQYRQDRAI